MRSVAVVALALFAAPLVVTACSSSGSPAAAKDCSSLAGAKVATVGSTQVAAACSAIKYSDGQFPCSVAGRSVGSIYYVKTAKGNYAGRNGGTWKSATATQAEKLGVLAKLAGCDVT